MRRHVGTLFLRVVRANLSRERRMNITRGSSPTTWEQRARSAMWCRAADRSKWKLPSPANVLLPSYNSDPMISTSSMRQSIDHGSLTALASCKAKWQPLPRIDLSFPIVVGRCYLRKLVGHIGDDDKDTLYTFLNEYQVGMCCHAQSCLRSVY